MADDLEEVVVTATRKPDLTYSDLLRVLATRKLDGAAGGGGGLLTDLPTGEEILDEVTEEDSECGEGKVKVVVTSGATTYTGCASISEVQEYIGDDNIARVPSDSNIGMDIIKSATDTEDTTTTETSTDAASQISDEEAISAVLASVPDKLKGIFTEQNIMKVLEAVMDDPLTKIKKAQGAGVSTDELFEGWENWKVFGPLAIPGVPLPPGIFEVTLEEIVKAAEQAKQSVGDFVNGILTDPEKTLEDLGKGIKDIVTGVFGGTIKDPGFGGTIGGFGDWIKGILGNSIGGLVFSGIYDFVDGVFNSSETSIPVVGGTKEDEEETTGDPTTRFAQLLGTVEDNLAVDSDLFGTADITADDDTTPGGDITKDITNLLGGTIAQLDTTPVVDTTVGGTATGDDITKKITTLLGGAINQLDTTDTPQTVTTEIGGGGPAVEPPPPVDPGGEDGGNGGGGTVDPENPPPVVVDPGGPPPSSSSGGGGAVGGSDGMFEGAMRGLSYMPQALPGVRQAPPLDAMGSLNMLIDGLLTGRRA